MNKLEKAKEIIKENYVDGGLYFVRNICGDPMKKLYEDSNIRIDICKYYEYFEVFGLDKKEQKELTNYYNSLKED